MALFYTLPDDSRITLRGIEKPLRRLITSMFDRWQGDRVSVVLREDVDVEGAEGYYGGCHRARMLNLVTGVSTPASPSFERTGSFPHCHGYRGALVPGDALVIFRNKRPGFWYRELRDLDVTFRLRAFSPDDRVVEALSVARDAVLSGDDQRGYQVARTAADHSHGPATPGRTTTFAAYGLFVALCKKERAILSNIEGPDHGV